MSLEDDRKGGKESVQYSVDKSSVKREDQDNRFTGKQDCTACLLGWLKRSTMTTHEMADSESI